jgi:hypothetical protein
LTIPATGVDGRATCELTAGTYTFRIVPQRLMSEEAQRRLREEADARGEEDPFARFWITVGTATITAGEATTLELRLPPEWEK